MVVHLVANQSTRVRFPYPALNMSERESAIFDSAQKLDIALFEKLGVRVFCMNDSQFMTLLVMYKDELAKSRKLFSTCNNGIRSHELNLLIKELGISTARKAKTDTGQLAGSDIIDVGLSIRSGIYENGLIIPEGFITEGNKESYNGFDTLIVYQDSNETGTSNIERFIGQSLQALAEKEGITSFPGLEVIIVLSDTEQNHKKVNTIKNGIAASQEPEYIAWKLV